jgi:hypothetical protein
VLSKNCWESSLRELAGKTVMVVEEEMLDFQIRKVLRLFLIKSQA